MLPIRWRNESSNSWLWNGFLGRAPRIKTNKILTVFIFSYFHSIMRFKENSLPDEGIPRWIALENRYRTNRGASAFSFVLIYLNFPAKNARNGISETQDVNTFCPQTHGLQRSKLSCRAFTLKISRFNFSKKSKSFYNVITRRRITCNNTHQHYA